MSKKKNDTKRLKKGVERVNVNGDDGNDHIVCNGVEIAVDNNQSQVKSCFIQLKRLNQIELDEIMKPRYNLRTRNKKNLDMIKPVKKNNTKLVRMSNSNKIWLDLSAKHYKHHIGSIVLAKMNCYRPWPAKINSIYSVNRVVKVFVFFYGTEQIGSVSEVDCIPFSEAKEYLFHALNEIKEKYKWKIDYDKILCSSDLQRATSISKLTLVQKFLLSLREVEKIHHIPISSSMLN